MNNNMNNNNELSYMLFPTNIAVIVEGRTYSVSNSDRDKYKKVWKLIKDNDKEGLISLLSNNTNISNKLGINISAKGIVTYTNKQGIEERLPPLLYKAITRLYTEDIDSIEPLIKFWENLKLNPSYRPLNFLYEFVEQKNIVINKKGNLIMYKIVGRTNEPNVFIDLYTRTFKHELGKPVSISRNQVDDNIDNTCSFGLHVCTWDYLPHYGNAVKGNDAILLVEVNPKDIVAIPRDYNNSKLRVCSYTPIAEYTYDKGEIDKILFDRNISNDDYNYNDKEDEDEDNWNDED